MRFIAIIESENDNIFRTDVETSIQINAQWAAVPTKVGISPLGNRENIYGVTFTASDRSNARSVIDEIYQSVTDGNVKSIFEIQTENDLRGFDRARIKNILAGVELVT